MSDLFSNENLPDNENLPQTTQVDSNESQETGVSTESSNLTTALVHPDTTSLIIANADEMEVLNESFPEEKSTLLDLVVICQRAVKITDKATKEYAHDIAKRANDLVKKIESKTLETTKPFREKVDVIRSAGKKLSEPLNAEVKKLKAAITEWDLEQLRLQNLELERIRKEKEEQERKERAERDRVAKIKAEIEKIKTQALADINNIEDLESLNQFESRLCGWKPKQEFFAEFMPELDSVISDLKTKIQIRRPIIEELTKQKEALVNLDGEQKEAAEKIVEQNSLRLQQEKESADLKMKEEQALKDKKEIVNRQELVIFVAGLNYTSDVEAEVANLVSKYGSATAAIEKKSDIINNVNQQRIQHIHASSVNKSKPKNLRTVYKFKIINEADIPRDYLTVDDEKINDAIVANRQLIEKDLKSFMIPGIEIYPEVTTVLR